MMDDPQGALQNLTVRAYGRMLRLYPSRFHREFASEIHAVFQERMAEAGNQAALSFQEIIALAWSHMRRNKGE